MMFEQHPLNFKPQQRDATVEINTCHVPSHGAAKTRSFSELVASGNVPAEIAFSRVEKKRRIGDPKVTIRSIPMKKSSWWSFGDIQKDLIQGLSKNNNILSSRTSSTPSMSAMRMNYPPNISAMSNHHFSLPLQHQQRNNGLEAKQGNPTIASLLRRNSPAQIVSRIVGEPSVTAQSLVRHPVPNGTLTSAMTLPSDQAWRHSLTLNNPYAGTASTDDDNNSTNSSSLKFRAYQAENWTEKFEELITFRNHYGHCLVPNSFPDNTGLAQWVKRQRYQFKLKQEGKRSTMSDERIQALEDIGFVWDSHSAIWDERVQELLEYKQMHGDCNVPSRYAENRQLAVWVKRQRRQYKFFVNGEPSSMSEERIKRLNEIGFQWDLRKSSSEKDDENDSE